MNCVFIIPTGLGAEIGGHSGDATPAAKLIAAVCDNLIVHPNVVNAADINEMTDNMLYVEGSILTRFLDGKIELKKAKGNKILLAVNEVTPAVVNAASAARATMGADITIVELNRSLKMEGFLDPQSGLATGTIKNAKEAIKQVQYLPFDVLVVHTPIRVDREVVFDYLEKPGGVNPWGWVEAQLSKIMSRELNRPVIHAPVENMDMSEFNQAVDPRKAAETVSTCYIHCCFKGAHVAPKIVHTGGDLRVQDMDFLISPAGIWGPPHDACCAFGIPIIVVEENTCVCRSDDAFFNAHEHNIIYVNNYLEAAGVVAAKKAGVVPASVRRPLEQTRII